MYNFQVKKVFKSGVCILSSALMFIACSNNDFHLKGEIYGAEQKTLVLERTGFQGEWIPVDSVKINKNGGFSMKFPSPDSPEIFRLVLNGRYIYIPIDSNETLTISSSFEKFGNDFKLSGSPNAERLEQFEKELQSQDTSNPDSLIDFKRGIYTKYMKDLPGSIISFYILTKTVDDKPLYNPSNSDDIKYFSAVATGFKTARPEAPQTKLLEQTALNALKIKNKEEGKFRSIEAEEISLIDIDLQNENGQNVKLSDIAGNGKPVVVIFSLLNHQDSPDLNLQLAQIYNKHNGKVEFYNVSLDADQYSWREAARNLPWITVFSPGQDASVDARHYNVFQIPSFFIYDSQGVLTSRPLTLDELDKNL
ncbi:MAG: DUF4369 domain-containing protein [Muribaculaceae bacterium]|nr:DUF4369 domain-containing protein [Muribaculaceae bacterium]